jgi:hypothetical protein
MGVVDWTDLVQDVDRRQALVNSVVYLQVPYSGGGTNYELVKKETAARS